ncbi:hypothetical protein LINPERPRIM_LOCUS14634 [Linum perenne]
MNFLTGLSVDGKLVES